MRTGEFAGAARLTVVEVRPARRQDAGRLVRLFDQWGHSLAGEDIQAVLMDWEQTLHAEVLLAEIDDLVAGMAAVVARPYLARPGRCAHLVGLVVAHDNRRRGVGGTLLVAAEEQARAWGCDRMELTSSRSRIEAHAFYPDRGYEEQSHLHARYLRPL